MASTVVSVLELKQELYQLRVKINMYSLLPNLKIYMKNFQSLIRRMRASANNAGAFVNLLNAEMEGLVKASSFNFGRMLYGDGTGLLATVSAYDGTTGAVTVDSVRNLIEGMIIDTYNGASKVSASSGLRVSYVDRTANKFYLTVPSGVTPTFASNYAIYLQNSKGLEKTGLGAIFSESDTLYGLTRLITLGFHHIQIALQKKFLMQLFKQH
jgi:hypothetical protein